MASLMQKMVRLVTKATVTIASAAMIAGAPAAAQQVPSDTWMGIYLGQAKVGHARFSVEAAKTNGKPGFKLTSTSVTRLIALGEQVEQQMETVVYLSDKFEPKYQVFRMSSDGHTSTVTARYTRKEITAEVASEGSKNIKQIPIPAGSKIVGDSTFISPTLKLKVGDEFELKCFNPLTISLDDIQMTVLRKEDVSLNGARHQAFVIKTLSPMGEMNCWQDDKGELWKVTAIAGIVMLREPKEVALSDSSEAGVYTPPSDLAVMTSAPTATELTDPRSVNYLKVRLSGLADRSLVISDARQKAGYTPGDAPHADYEITASRFDASQSETIDASAKGVSGFTGDTPYVQPSDPDIQSVVKETVGNETNAYKAASKLREWVFTHMHSKGTIGIVRSSVDVLRAKSGVCRDYAVLYAALARAAGIPTKLVSGLIYWRGGFFYHAWTEVYVGKWVPMDATLPTDFVDATHIKLAEGEATSMYNTVKVMGTIKAEILAHKP